MCMSVRVHGSPAYQLSAQGMTDNARALAENPWVRKRCIHCDLSHLGSRGGGRCILARSDEAAVHRGCKAEICGMEHRKM